MLPCIVMGEYREDRLESVKVSCREGNEARNGDLGYREARDPRESMPCVRKVSDERAFDGHVEFWSWIRQWESLVLCRET